MYSLSYLCLYCSFNRDGTQIQCFRANVNIPRPNNRTKLNPGREKNFFNLLNLWHYSAAFTLDQYGHVVDSMKEASAERMQAFIDTLVNV